MEANFVIDVDGARTTGRFYGVPTGVRAHATLVLAPGAGAPQTHPWLIAATHAFVQRGIDVATFNFVYAERGRSAPDKNDVLEAAWRAAIRAVREGGGVRSGRLFVGGKSMGGRIATQVAAGSAEDLAGLVLLGYPLHPPGKPDQLRASHLPRVRAPMLFVQGSRDAFGTPEELTPILQGLSAGTRLFVVEGGDHSFSTPRRGGSAREQILERIADEVARFTRDPFNPGS